MLRLRGLDKPKDGRKRDYHRDCRVAQAEIIVIMIMFHSSLRKRTIIETINDELKSIAQIEHSRHRSFPNFIVNPIGGIADYCLLPKKTMINLERSYSKQLILF